MPAISRRQLLGTAAGAAAASMLPPSLHRAMAQPMRPGELRAVEHVVVLMQENRSFDHYLGTLAGVRGYGDRTPLVLRNGSTIFEQPIVAGGKVLPYSVREGAEQQLRPDTDIQYLGGLDHSHEGSTAAWAQGWNDGWIAAKTPPTMTYYERQDVPLQYELADAFTICDAYHCSMFGPTNPNRNYLWSGKIGFEPGTTTRAVGNDAYSYDHPGYEWTSYPERLEAAGVSWQIYQEWDNFTDNPVEYFVPFKRIGTKMLAAVDGTYRTTEEFYDSLGGKSPDERQRLLGQLATGRARLTAAERRLFDRAMYRSEPGTLVARLRADIAAGRLPAVTWIVPPAADSEHPGAGTPVGGANLVYNVLDVIASHRATWSKTALFINYDENDGYFDHVPPAVAPRPASGDSDDWANGLPIGLGPRVAMTVVSPWTIGGHVDSELADHTSVVRFLERWTGVAEPNISDWRRGALGDLTSAFDFGRAGRPPRADRPAPVPAPITRWYPLPPALQALPDQEPGRRPARALPYRPGVAGALDRGGQLQLRLSNRGPGTAHFAIYPYAGEFPYPAHLDAHGDHVETIALTGGLYKLAVQGPNRFWYELAGSQAGLAARVDVRTVPDRSRDASEQLLVLDNAGALPVTLRLRALAYGTRTQTVRLGPREQRTVAWRTDGGWYDVEVTAVSDPTFRRRLTGRVEDGRPGVTA